MIDYSTIGFLFDLDGVLIDSENKYTQIWTAINNEFPSGYSDLATRIKGTTLEFILAQYYPDKDIREKVEQRLYEKESEMKYDFTPGAEKLLHWLSENKVPTALVTSSNQLKMNHLWKEIPGMDRFFNQIITGDMVNRSKPDPEGYQLAASLLGVDNKRCVVFEDSLQGVKAGKSAGSLVVGVAGTLSEEILLPYSNIIVHSLKELNPETIIRILSER